jgi:Spy/CpxP family protein refolding chaperone
MKRSILAVAALALLATAGARAAETNRPGRGPRGPGGPGGPRLEAPLIAPRLMDDLKLTADQKPKVDAIAADFARNRDKLLADQKNNPAIAKLRDEMKAAREAGDRQKMQELRSQLMPYDKPIFDLRKESMDKVRALLTDEQRKTLDEARQRFGRRNGPPPSQPPLPDPTGKSEPPPKD